jgi:3-methyladenine DNA glycosylase AlkD
MSTVDKIVAELEKLGSPAIKNVLIKHGAKEPFFGVKVGDMKTIVKRIKKDHALALQLFDTGIGDAQYLAGLISDPPQMTKAQIQKWAKTATWGMVSAYTVPWVASESRFGVELANEWIESPKEVIAAGGWATFSSLVSIKADEELDLAELEKLLGRVQKTIRTSPNRVRYHMNGYVIAVGCFVKPLNAKAKAIGKAIGIVGVDMGDTECKVPDAVEYISKREKMGLIGKKRKSAMC